jgi:peptide/nickel transport system permease protein
MLSQASGLIGTPKVYLLYFPGLFILVTVLAVNFVGDGLRDALDPRSSAGPRSQGTP